MKERKAPPYSVICKTGEKQSKVIYIAINCGKLAEMADVMLPPTAVQAVVITIMWHGLLLFGCFNRRACGGGVIVNKFTSLSPFLQLLLLPRSLFASVSFSLLFWSNKHVFTSMGRFRTEVRIVLKFDLAFYRSGIFVLYRSAFYGICVSLSIIFCFRCVMCWFYCLTLLS